MQSKKLLPAIVLALAISPSMQAFAQHEGHSHGKEEGKPTMQQGEGVPITIQGEVLDMACYMKHEGMGSKHKACAQSCLDEGSPVGIRTADGKVYFLVEDHDAKKTFETLKTKAAEQVKVTGTLHERGGTQAVVVKTVEAVK